MVELGIDMVHFGDVGDVAASDGDGETGAVGDVGGDEGTVHSRLLH